MSNIFTYSKGYLVEKPSWDKKPDDDEEDEVFGMKKINAYNEHIAKLRRFKYDYPDPKKEMELGKDFEVAHDWETMTDIAILIERTYSEQDLLDVWDAAGNSAYHSVKPEGPCDFDTEAHKQDKQQFFKQKFGIEIK